MVLPGWELWRVPICMATGFGLNNMSRVLNLRNLRMYLRVPFQALSPSQSAKLRLSKGIWDIYILSQGHNFVEYHVPQLTYGPFRNTFFAVTIYVYGIYFGIYLYSVLLSSITFQIYVIQLKGSSYLLYALKNSIDLLL